MEETIGQRLLRLRKERGLSQRQLAEPGVTAVYICRIEKGQRTPSVTVIRKLAEKLKVPAHYLETGQQLPLSTLKYFSDDQLFQEIRRRFPGRKIIIDKDMACIIKEGGG